jgi:hypothetical protein
MTQARDQATETWDYANLLTHAKNDDRTYRTLGLGARRTIGYRTPTEPVEQPLSYWFVEPPVVAVECRR